LPGDIVAEASGERRQPWRLPKRGQKKNAGGVVAGGDRGMAQLCQSHSSVHMFLGDRRVSIYGGTKAAVRNMVRSWVTELKGTGIRINILSPGPTNTRRFPCRADGATTHRENGRKDRYWRGTGLWASELSVRFRLTADKFRVSNGSLGT
jgi:NAD(P)-dependent dehydrogenase (short-subunit alcohol dehydrogenase family)